MNTNPSFSQMVFIVALLGALPACGGGSNSPAPEAAPAPSPPTVAEASVPINPALAQEYAALPPAVIVRIPLGADGQPLPAAAEMRAAPAAATDSKSAAAAFQAGKVVASKKDELDRSTSTQSWGGIGGVLNFLSFLPRMLSAFDANVTYWFGHGRSYADQGGLYYVYDKPACGPGYCGSTGAPGVPAGLSDDELLAKAFKTYAVYRPTEQEFLKGTKEQIDLGGRLFYDPILSAKGDVACASCHLDQKGTSNGLALGPTGEVLGGRKLGPLGVSDLLGRNIPALYNLGHGSFTNMFWDARIAVATGQPAGFISPAGAELPVGLNSALAVQALFPLVGPKEMGCGVLDATGALKQSQSRAVLWSQVMARVLGSPEYQRMFALAFPEVKGSHFGIEHLGNAIAAFESWRWRADLAPFDRYLAGDLHALNPEQKRGAVYFYGKGQCGSCHSGPWQTDHGAHATAVPQFGPGNEDGAHGMDDYGMGKTVASLRYKFRTPSLRNVALSGPWGHNGAWGSLKGFVAHYADPVAALEHWTPDGVALPQGVQADHDLLATWLDPLARRDLAAANELKPVPLSPNEIDAIVTFMGALTDPRSVH